jgi:hypothetical protein
VFLKRPTSADRTDKLSRPVQATDGARSASDAAPAASASTCPDDYGAPRFESQRGKIPWVGDLQLGAAITFGQWRPSFTHVFRTREYRTELHADQFGAFNLSYRF